MRIRSRIRTMVCLKINREQIYTIIITINYNVYMYCVQKIKNKKGINKSINKYLK
jgi:hypothetical protein